MKKRFFQCSALLFFLIAHISCFKMKLDLDWPKQERCPFPAVTSEGLNTFGCKVNGKEWVPCVDFAGSFVLNAIEPRYLENDGNGFDVSLFRSVYDSLHSNVLANGRLHIFLKPLYKGMHTIPENFQNSTWKFHYSDSLQMYGAYDSIDLAANNIINITRLDTAMNIIAGEFEVHLVNKTNGTKAHITEGRFDLPYHPL